MAVSDYFLHLTPFKDRLEINKLANKNIHISEKFIFYNNQENVTIGRDKKCNINFLGDKAISRIQATFIYDKTIKLWKVRDGTGKQCSINGTW